jgi:hypothetical protein
MLGFVLLGLSSLASATDAVSIPRVTPYADGVGNDDVRQKCDWNAKLSENIAQSAEGGVSVTDQDLSQISGKVLTMKVIGVHAIGGGGFTGPKWAKVQGELHDGDKLVGSFVAERRSLGGGLTACRLLTSLGQELGEDIAEWLKNPTLDAKL